MWNILGVLQIGMGIVRGTTFCAALRSAPHEWKMKKSTTYVVSTDRITDSDKFC